MNPIRLVLLTEKSSYRTDPPSTGEAEWNWQDYAHAAGASGCSDLEAAALEYRWRQAKRCRHMLFGALLAEAVKAEQRHGWSERLYGKRYMEPMVQLALDVEAMPAIDGVMPLVFPDGDGYKRYPGWWCIRLPWLTEKQWKKDGERRYSVIRTPLDIWAGEAVRKCRKLLRDDWQDFS